VEKIANSADIVNGRYFGRYFAELADTELQREWAGEKVARKAERLACHLAQFGGRTGQERVA
jgi:hypothetical protein